MLGYVYGEDGKLSLREVARPTAKKDTAVVKINAASVCGTDFRTYMNGSPKIVPGTVIGHECCATIIEKGDGVKGFKVGDRVQIAPAIGCGECRPCKKGWSTMCDHLYTIGFQCNGVFAEYMEIPAIAFERGNVNHVPENISDEEAALAEPMACALNAQEICHVEKGDVVAIFGSGFIGCSHAELAFAAGASKVFMMEVMDFRIEQAKKLVPNITMINSKEVNLYDTIMKETNGCGADVVITACSVGPVHTDALNIAAKLGRVSLFGGIPGDGKGYLDSNIIHYKELGVFGVHASTAEQNRTILKKISEGKLKPEKYITREYPLKDIGDAFEGIRNGKVLKAIIKP